MTRPHWPPRTPASRWAAPDPTWPCRPPTPSSVRDELATLPAVIALARRAAHRGCQPDYRFYLHRRPRPVGPARAPTPATRRRRTRRIHHHRRPQRHASARPTRLESRPHPKPSQDKHHPAGLTPDVSRGAEIPDDHWNPPDETQERWETFMSRHSDSTNPRRRSRLRWLTVDSTNPRRREVTLLFAGPSHRLPTTQW
jgi:hypothetical protein